MKELMAVAAGGALGAVARYLVYVMAAQVLGTGFPFGTLIVNVVGSFAMGVLVEGMALVWTVPMQVRLFLAVGILGAFTTFSTFSLDVAVLYERGRFDLVGFYITVSVVCSVAALFVGLYVMRRVVAPAF